LREAFGEQKGADAGELVVGEGLWDREDHGCLLRGWKPVQRGIRRRLWEPE
jgi:hypothetical protein